ncbi:HAD family phosphatase [uncultured Acetatifactor sp.]|jgi:putative hydrolase of the HAD superfamily|uniref:HAD family hydrolase n=1 Tax=uncultured Acetatifactor sp. TaxID=1671927 RepID=UPI00262A292E|nr:HAD family phosphatase [uncultured Acetatifactor sp.]
MIRNIIFDIGNVLTDFRWKEFLEDKGFDEAMVKRIAKASVQSTVWNEIDRGVWSMEELMQAFIRQDPEIEEELRRAYDDITGMVTKRAYAIPWIQELREKGYRVYYLSNFSEKAYEDCADALDFLPYTDGGILSYREKLVKPDPEIYRRLLSRYSLEAQESVFLDDTAMNVEAAERLGIHGICFRTKEQAEEELRGLVAAEP